MAFRGWISALLVLMVSALPVVRAACDVSCVPASAPAPAADDAGAAAHCPSHPAAGREAEVPDETCEHAHEDGRITVSRTAAPAAHALDAWVPLRAALALDLTIAPIRILVPLTPDRPHALRFIPLRI